jgi:methylated-DNA-protein-cysteine methyltransferase-like protein
LVNKPESNYERIYRVVERIPKGRVATYGQVASLAGLYGQARLVGYALAATPDDLDLPWHRVINSRGQVSIRVDPGSDHLQRILLESEGVRFDSRGRVPLDEFLWRPDT